MSDARPFTASIMMRATSLRIGPSSSISIDLAVRSRDLGLASTDLSNESPTICFLGGPSALAPPLMYELICRLEAMPACSNSPTRKRNISSVSMSMGSWMIRRNLPLPAMGRTKNFLIKSAGMRAVSILFISETTSRLMKSTLNCCASALAMSSSLQALVSTKISPSRMPRARAAANASST